MPDALNEAFVRAAGVFVTAIAGRCLESGVPAATLTAEAYGMAFQALVINAQRKGHDSRQVIAGLGSGFGRVLGSQTPDDSGAALALFLKAVSLSEVDDRRGGTP